MSFLPIVDRELRAAARRKSTYRTRWWTVVIAILANFVFLLIAAMSSGSGQAGQVMFRLLIWYTFGLCLFAGVFLTADCLSEEKREGTLGLLFLTDLKGYDVVLGKFIARSLNAFYGLLAILPIMGLPLLVGGVTGGEFWRVTLGLINALFFSLTAGIWISSWSQDATRAMGRTFALLLALVAGLPGLAAAVPAFRPPNPLGYVALLSPFYHLVLGLDAGYLGNAGQFWGALAASHAVGWLWLGLASFTLPRGWQDEGVGRAFNPGGTAKRRRELLPINPILWLVGDEPTLRRLVWAIVGLWGLVALGFGWESAAPRAWGHFIKWSKAFGFILKMCVAVQACRFFSEARRTGALELLLCTPLRGGEIVKGQWLAIRRMFLWPFLIFLLLGFFPMGVQIGFLISKSSLASFWNGVVGFGASLVAICWFALSLFADSCAVGWFGMWLALTAKRPNLAAAMTILFVLVLPSPFCAIDLLVDLFFILWGATRLQQDFRWVIHRR